MAAVAVEVTPNSFHFDKKAEVFIAEIEVPKDGAKEVKTVPVFVLNSSEFINLQLYLQAGMKLPRDENDFTSTYPKTGFDTYLGKDPELYTALSTQLPLIHQHCADFQGKTVGPMITTGGIIADFANDAADYHKDVLAGLDVMCSPNTKKGDPAFDDAKASVRSVLRKLSSHAKTTKEECDSLVTQLSQFKTTTTTDKATVEKLNKRFHASIPSESERANQLRSTIQKSKDALKAVQDQAEATHKEAIERGKDKWYYYVGIIGVCILIYDTIKQKGLIETLNNLNKIYGVLQAKGRNEEAQLTQAFSQVNSLTASVGDVNKFIDGAITAVGNMQTAFSLLSSDFKKLRDQLDDVGGDIDEKGMELLVSKKDLEKAQATWAQIVPLARSFQLNGVLLQGGEKLPEPPK